jgi:hypothetical protein
MPPTLSTTAPIHLVQATLGHSSVATTSAYLRARPGDSSARFLALEKSSPDSGQADGSRKGVLMRSQRSEDRGQESE